ncbi:MAG: type II toxin-antitoxin system death-on-curing family toxin [Pirellulales bacterium]
MNVIFLAIESILEIHRFQIERYGGIVGVRDVQLLQSAVAMPAAQFDGQFLHADLFEMAAAYLFHIVQNHPFLDGNKRVGAAAAATFLEMNELPLLASPDDYAELTLSVARGEVDKAVIADFFRANSRQL